MKVTESFVERKFNIRIGSKGVSREYCSDVVRHVDSKGSVSVHENKKLDMNCNLKLPYKGASKKRGPFTVLENEMEKRRKMDQGIKQQCANMLEDLQNHRCAWPFKKPVDPVAFNIPDYFSIVKNPMDFGTIESKLQRNVYFSVDEFAADVRLTFSNCMLYNPPFNQFHVAARELKSYFENKWKLLEKKMKFESKSDLLQCRSNGTREITQGRVWMNHKAFPSKASSVSRRTMSVEEKQKLVKDLKELLRGKMKEKLQSILQKYNLCSLTESIGLDIGGIDDEVLWQLKRTANSLLKVTVAKIEPAKVTQSSVHPLCNKDIKNSIHDVSRVSCSSAKVKPPASSVNSKCGSCGSFSCHCRFSSSKVQSCKMKHRGHKGVSRTDCCKENLTASCSGRLDPDANGSLSVVEEAACVSPDSSMCGSTVMADEAIDIHVSPKKALRAAILKSRFADTIFKARHKTLLDQCDKTDPVKLQREKDKLEQQHREEKARIEAQIVAAEAASRLRAQSERKMHRQREREAARIALEQMKRTVDIDDNLKFLRDLELMSQSPESCNRLADSPLNPLEQLGLYFKEDFVEDDDVDEALATSEYASEEGEILEF